MTGRTMAKRLTVDKRRGHINVVGTEPGSGLTFTETGDRLDAWCWSSGVTLTPAMARRLAAALNAWADRRAALSRQQADQ